MLTINLPYNLEQKVIEYARQKNEKIDKIIAQALKFYLNEDDEFMKELKMWDCLSDEAWNTFEKECL